MYFAGESSIGNVIMMLTYVLLLLFWLYVFVEILVHRNSSNVVLRYGGFRRLVACFTFFSLFIFLESVYWALATAGRIGILPDNINNFFYYSWHIIAIKSLLLLGGVAFIFIFRRTHKNLEQEFESLYFTQFLDSSIDAVGVLDKEGRVLFWNRGAVTLYGYSKEYVRAKKIHSFLVPKRFQGHLKVAMHRIQNDNKAQRFRVYRNTKDDGEIEVDITMTPFLDKGKFAGYFGIMRPTTGGEDVNQIDYPEVEENASYPELDESDVNGQQNNLPRSAALILSILALSLIILFVAIFSEKKTIQNIAIGILSSLIITLYFSIINLTKKGINLKRIATQILNGITNESKK